MQRVTVCVVCIFRSRQFHEDDEDDDGDPIRRTTAQLPTNLPTDDSTVIFLGIGRFPLLYNGQYHPFYSSEKSSIYEREIPDDASFRNEKATDRLTAMNCVLKRPNQRARNPTPCASSASRSWVRIFFRHQSNNRYTDWRHSSQHLSWRVR